MAEVAKPSPWPWTHAARGMQNLGFLAPGTDVVPIAEALRSTWAESLSEAGLANFSFRTLTDQFNKLLYM